MPIISGTIVRVEPVETGTDKKGKDFSRQRFIVEVVDGNHVKKICLTAWNDMQRRMAKYAIGSPIEVDTNIESRQVNDKWYTDIKPWRILED